MIVRQIKSRRQTHQVLESLKQVDQDMDASEYQETTKRTLNPEHPLPEVSDKKVDKLICHPSETILSFEGPKSQQTGLLPQEQPLHCDSYSQEPLQTFKTVSIDVPPNGKIWPRFGLNRTHREQTRNNLGLTFYKSLNLKVEPTNQPPKRIRNNRVPFKESKIYRQIEQRLHQHRYANDQEANGNLKNRFDPKVKQNKLAQTLSKFKSLRRCQQTPEKKSRYSCFKPNRIQNQSTKPFLTEQPSSRIILDHLMSKTASIHSERKVRRHLVPRDQDSIDKQFSSIFDLSCVPKVQDSDEQVVPNCHVEAHEEERQKVTISYKTTLLQLKKICNQYRPRDELMVLIAQPLAEQKFFADQNQKQSFRQAKILLKSLGINASALSIKRYTNCLILNTGPIAIVSHYSGQVYLGGWNGQKTGLGLQWCPGAFVYYGQYRHNKRNGVGIYKSARGEVAAGLWKGSQFQGPFMEVFEQ